MDKENFIMCWRMERKFLMHEGKQQNIYKTNNTVVQARTIFRLRELCGFEVTT